MQVFLKPLTPSPRSPEKPPGQGVWKVRAGLLCKEPAGWDVGRHVGGWGPSLSGFPDAQL